MRALRIEARGTAAGCVLLLPGAQQQPEDFVRHGFDGALRARALALDLILAAPQLAHLTDRAWLPRLRDEIVRPQRASGRALWIGGTSLGAFMALRFAAEYPTEIDGLCLLAPYLGSRIVAAEIARFEPLQAWQPGALSDEDDERRIWRFARQLRSSPPQVFLGFGRGDRFADTQRLLARALPAGSCAQIDGGHDWPVWRQLWENFLDRRLLDAQRAGGAPP